jgi:glycosyltransferase involved in cell wall biosynthesis
VEQGISEQTLEVLLVDDCSTDGSLKIALSFAQRHSFFRIIKAEKNQGISVARNLALEQMNGEYLMFVDSDDLLAPSFLTSLFEKIEQSPAEFIYFEHISFWEHKEEHCSYQGESNKVIETIESPKSLLQLPYCPFGKVFHHSLFEQLRFDSQLRRCEDLALIPAAMFSAKNYLYLPQVGYRYRERESSNSRIFEVDIFKQAIINLNEISSLSACRAELDYIVIRELIFSLVRFHYAGNLADTAKELRISRRLLCSLIPSWSSNHYAFKHSTKHKLFGILIKLAKYKVFSLLAVLTIVRFG